MMSFRSSTVSLGLLLGLLATGQTLQQQLQGVASANGLVGMSVVAVCEGAITDVVHTGLADIGRNVAVNDSTAYRIASISKLVTAIAVMRLHEQSTFGLDDDVSTALGFTFRNPAFPNTPITYRMVLSHRSSLQDGSGYSPFLTATYSSTPPPAISELVTSGGNWYTADMWRTESPGSYFAYSNVNFGILGTLIEALSGQRFDQYMRQEVLAPLGIGGSYNVQDLSAIGQLAALYRNSVPQADDFNGLMPAPPDLSLYVIGTNGLYFAPQGGLRITAVELARVLLCLLGNGTWTNGITTVQLLQPTTVALMTGQEWLYNGNNGDNYYGLFRSWGLGVHRITATPGNDVVHPGVPMFGHAGEAYGLISDLYFDPSSGHGLLFLTNGYTPGNAYAFGNTAFYSVEDDVFAAVRTHAYQPCLSVAVQGSAGVSERLLVNGNTIRWTGTTALEIRVFDPQGKLLEQRSIRPHVPISWPGAWPMHARSWRGGGIVVLTTAPSE